MFLDGDKNFMIRIGVLLFTIGLILISPVDEIFILLPLSAMYGMWIFPLFLVIALFCLILGGLLIGRHILPYLENPLVLFCIFVSAVIMIYLIVGSGWLDPFLEAL